MKLPLTIPLDAQTMATVQEAMKPGVALIGRVGRVWATGDPASDALAGNLFIELGAVPEAAIPAMRKAIEDARQAEVIPGKPPAKKKKP